MQKAIVLSFQGGGPKFKGGGPQFKGSGPEFKGGGPEILSVVLDIYLSNSVFLSNIFVIAHVFYRTK